MAATKPVAKKAAKPTPPVAKKPMTPVSKPATKTVVKAKAAPAPPPKKAVPAKNQATKPTSKATAPSPKKAAYAAPVKAAKPAAKVAAAKSITKPTVNALAKPQKAGTKVAVKQKIAAAPQTPVAPKPVVQSIVEKVEKKTPPPAIIMPAKKKEETKPSKIVVPKTSVKTAVKYEPDFMKSVLDPNSQPETPIAPTMRYSDNDLAEFRDLIKRKLDAAKKELSYLQGLITRKDEMGGDNDDARYMTMEDGSLSMEREQLSQMASRQITFVDHLEKALMRIESKTYGVCRVTGKLIDKARLRAVPHATLSVEAKMGKVRLP